MLVSARLRPFGTTIFAEISCRARERGAINLGQGFPDFEGPDFVKEAAARALFEEHNQYAPLPGLPTLRAAVARAAERQGGAAPDPDREVTITAGCTEAITAALLGLLEPGDEVVLFEPFYDSYRAAVAMAGAEARFVPLMPDAEGVFGFDPDDLDAAIGPSTRAILLNTPHNPTGKVFAHDELESIAARCIEHDLLALSDEVYEHLVYDGEHVPLRTLPGMAERTVTLSSLGKTFSLTGWKIGWAIGAPELTAGIRAAHQFITFSVATPLQHAAAAALDAPADYYDELRDGMRSRRDRLAAALADVGFRFQMPAAGYFILADHAAVSEPLGLADDVEVCDHLLDAIGVAAIPPSAFYAHGELGRPFVRFAFCKTDAVLDEAATRLRALAV